jgi:WD40 repeat protein
MKAPRTILVILLLLAAKSELRGQELKELATFKTHFFGPQKIAISADGKLLAAGGGDTRGGELNLWDLQNGKEIGSFPGYTNSLYALAFSPDGKLLASGDIEHRVMLWDVSARKALATFKGHTDWVHAVQFSPDGRTLASAGRKEVKLWDVASGKELASFTRIVEAWSMAFSQDLKTLASPNYQEIDLWDVTAGKERIILSEQRGHVRRVAFRADGKILAASSAVNLGKFHYQGQIKLWDTVTGKEVAILKGPFGEIYDLAISPDGDILALVEQKELHGKAELAVLELNSGRTSYRHKWPKPWFISLQFSPAGKLRAIGTMDTNVKVWEVTTAKR